LLDTAVFVTSQGQSFILLISAYHNMQLQEAQLMLTNPRDSFRGQSRSPTPNVVPFDMLGIYSFLLVCYSNFVPKMRYFSYSTLKKGISSNNSW